MNRTTLFFVSLLFFISCSAATKKDMNASEIVRLLQKGGDVQIADKIIWDDLDFSNAKKLKAVSPGLLQADVEGNVFFVNCVFMGKVTSLGKKGTLPVCTRFKSNLVFFECDFRGEVDFSSAIVYGAVNFCKSTFREKANFDQIAVWSKDSYFSEMKAEKEFSMIYSVVKGNLYFLNAAFAGRTSFQEIGVDGKLIFNNSVFKEKASFDLMSVREAAAFNYTTFEKGADFSSSRFLRTVGFVNANFVETGRFNKTYFLDAVNFEGVDVANSLTMTNVVFGNNPNK